MSQPAMTPRKYLPVFAGLIVLLLATTFIGKLDLGPFTMPIALFFATAKAALIVTFFMQAKFEPAIIRVFVAAGIIWVLIFLSNTVADYMTRGWLGFPGK